MDTNAPMPVTRARLLGACWIPTRALTFNGNVTSAGAMNTRLVLIIAKAYREMNPQPTRGAAAASVRSTRVSEDVLSMGGKASGNTHSSSRCRLRRRSRGVGERFGGTWRDHAPAEVPLA